MNSSCIISVGIYVSVLLVSGCFADDLEVKGSQDSSSDLKKSVASLKKNFTSNEKSEGAKLDLDHKSEKDKKSKDQVGDLKKEVGNNVTSSDSSKQSKAKEAGNGVSSKGDSSKGSKVDGDNGKKENRGSGLESKELLKGAENEEASTIAKPVKEGSSRGEECDPSNMCTDEEDKLVACLRVPGNESPHLSLLVQNKGKSPLSVAVLAPKYVQLGENNLQLQEKEDKTVKVSIQNGGDDTLIILAAGHGKCSLNFSHLVPKSSRIQSDYYLKFASINFLMHAPTIAFVSFAALLVLATAWLCISFRRRHFAAAGSKYQRLDMELPVSGEVKPNSDANDGWDNNWDDSWDDEEAPKTPTLPVTPSLSSKGLASRRLNKEGWKD